MGDPTCPCDKSLDYACARLMPGLNVGICTRTLGVCGEPVPLAKLSDFRGNSYLGNTCNELNDSRICDRSFADQSFDAEFQCRVLSKSGEGVCVAFCSAPALDRDGDGTIGNHEKGGRSQCPNGFSCRTDVARKLQLYSTIENSGSDKLCDPKKCTKNVPCPMECGPGDAECLTIGSGQYQRSLCGAPYGTCLLD